MSKHHFQPQKKSKPTTTSILDIMVDGREFESILNFSIVTMDLASEIRRSLSEIETIRQRPAIAYLANVINQKIKVSTAINHTDDLPFAEMVSSIDSSVTEIDVLLVSPGGSAEQVARFVDKLRPRFTKVTFILPYMAMSAGTIFALSGDEIIMDSRAYIGPIDPQVMNKDGQYVPAQAILALINDIQKRGDERLKQGQNPVWTDLQILRQLDGKEIGNAISASKYSIELVQNYLYQYKFRNWTEHSNGNIVSDEDKHQRANEIAIKLCDHGQWKTHSRGITREAAWNECKIKITHPETTPQLDRAIRRCWALQYWAFENTSIFKMYVSKEYAIFKNDPSLINNR